MQLQGKPMACGCLGARIMVFCVSLHGHNHRGFRQKRSKEALPRSSCKCTHLCVQGWVPEGAGESWFRGIQMCKDVPANKKELQPEGLICADANSRGDWDEQYIHTHFHYQTILSCQAAGAVCVHLNTLGQFMWLPLYICICSIYKQIPYLCVCAHLPGVTVSASLLAGLKAWNWDSLASIRHGAPALTVKSISDE